MPVIVARCPERRHPALSVDLTLLGGSAREGSGRRSEVAVVLYNRRVPRPSRWFPALLMAGLLALALLGRDPADEGQDGFPACCAGARLANAWCTPHDRGFVAGLEIRSRELHDALDAHGHTLDPTVMSCETCRTLAGTGGFCEEDHIGWVDGQGYFTRLTYQLALGRPSKGDERCAVCRADPAPSGWCQACDRGWAGNVVFERQDLARAAARELEHLLVVIETSRRCSTCALVQLVGDGRCPYCSITYAAGEPVESPGSPRSIER